MNQYKFGIFMFVISFFLISGNKAETKDIWVIEGIICKSIKDRNPIEPNSTFSKDIQRIYFYTKIGLELTDSSSIQHVWYHQDKQIAVVTLPIQGPQWRTYSSKQIEPMDVGQWRIDVAKMNQEVIQSFYFEIK